MPSLEVDKIRVGLIPYLWGAAAAIGEAAPLGFRVIYQGS
jgi:hypothetical protein